MVRACWLSGAPRLRCCSIMNSMREAGTAMPLTCPTAVWAPALAGALAAGLAAGFGGCLAAAWPHTNKGAAANAAAIDLSLTDLLLVLRGHGRHVPPDT